MGSGLEPLDEKSEVELRSDLESKRNAYNLTPGGEGSELQNFLTEREAVGSEMISEKKNQEEWDNQKDEENNQEDDKLSHINSQDSKVFDIDQTIDDLPEEAISEENSKTQLAH
jgi:hypothetical protein